MGDDLPEVSDQVLREAEAVRRLEREKRTLPPSAPTFRRLARDIEIRARRLLRLTRDEEQAADRTSSPTPIDDMHRDE
jgi:uncharacterized protein involved in exopolysaccharide biosynthesis